MNKAPFLGKESPPRSPSTPESGYASRRESQGPHPWSPSTTASISSWSSKPPDGNQSEIFNNSSTTISGDPGQYRMVVAIDYGTTFSGIGYAVHDNSRPELSNIRVVTNWGMHMDNEVKIPSVISYSPCTDAGEQQFGASLSPDAVAMVNTKLELEAQETRLDELDLIIQVLEGMKDLNFEYVKRAQGYPGYTWKAPEDIVTDYLTKAFEHFETATEYLTEIKTNVPVDIIVTVPVRWSYKAKNSTFRAIKNAGFNENTFPNLENYYLVTEPEAAALYAARFLKEQEAESLKKGECFVLCDAGGGTVDAVSYKVKQVEPSLELVQMTTPTGAKRGSSFINANFRKWLHGVLGEDNYNTLDCRSDGEKISAHAMEGGKMRHVMREFESHKKAFHGTSPEMILELPHPLHTVNIPGRVEDGDLTITKDDMRDFFDDCINGVIELIQGQISQVENKRNRVKTILLIGGFSESKFLQEELSFSLKMRKIVLRRPQTSWSAVVQGAVLYGMDMANRKNHTKMIPCPRSYGLLVDHTYSKRMHDTRDIYTDPFTNQTVAGSQFDWFVLKGDLLLAQESREIEKNLVFKFKENAQKVCSIHLFEYLDDDLIPDRYETAQEEVKEVGKLATDLSYIAAEEFERCQNKITGEFYYRVLLTCKFIILGTLMRCELWWNDQMLHETVLENIDKVKEEDLQP